MKHIFIAGVALLLLCLTACNSSTKKSQVQLTEMSSDEKPSEQPKAMSSIELVDIIQVKKEPYEYKIMRRCDQNLPLITNAEGQSYYDNRIILRLSYQHQVRYERVFTKQDFAQLVNARFLKHARFEGMAFDCVTDAGTIRFTASLTYPESDLYVPIRITLTTQGKMTMECDETMDELPIEENATQG